MAIKISTVRARLEATKQGLSLQPHNPTLADAVGSIERRLASYERRAIQDQFLGVSFSTNRMLDFSQKARKDDEESHYLEQEIKDFDYHMRITRMTLRKLEILWEYIVSTHQCQIYS
ncbi:MAG: hypothetical protein Q9192_006636 [Flavoplaca navasiana]